MGLRAFIVRPFKDRNGISFKQVQVDLINPALRHLKIEGGTTEEFLEAGSIHADMLQQLLVADIVIADVSVHNANVFYELGIRQALRPKHTFLLRAVVDNAAPEDRIPFDIEGERYFEYNPKEPANALNRLKQGLTDTLHLEREADSPVFRLLPGLEAQDVSRFLKAPPSFKDEVNLARKDPGRLGLLAMEARSFPWASAGLREVGRALFQLETGVKAKGIWEELNYTYSFSDVEANLKLGTIYRRLAMMLPRERYEQASNRPEDVNDLHRLQRVTTTSTIAEPEPNPDRLNQIDRSNQALQRVVYSKTASGAQRAESLLLLGENIQDHWVSSWIRYFSPECQVSALDSPDLALAYEKFRQAFQEDLNSFSPGVSALSLLTLTIELAKQQPDVWKTRFDAEDPDEERKKLERQRLELENAVKTSVNAARDRSGKKDWRIEVARADLEFLKEKKAKNLTHIYKSALSDPDSHPNDARERLEMFRNLGVFQQEAEAALKGFSSAPDAKAQIARVIVFAGNAIDPGRFPEIKARNEILKEVRRVCDRTEGPVLAIASGASGGDLLFHEVCAQLAIDHRLYLPVAPDTFRNEAVSPAGDQWTKRFIDVLDKCERQLNFASSTDLPVWLKAKTDYSVWRRASLWLIHEALALEANNFTFLALGDGDWNREGIDVAGMRALAADNGFAVVVIPPADLLKEDSAKV